MHLGHANTMKWCYHMHLLTRETESERLVNSTQVLFMYGCSSSWSVLKITGSLWRKSIYQEVHQAPELLENLNPRRVSKWWKERVVRPGGRREMVINELKWAYFHLNGECLERRQGERKRARERELERNGQRLDQVGPFKNFKWSWILFWGDCLIRVC